MRPDTMYEGSSFVLPQRAFTPPAGKVFAGWDKGAAGTAMVISGDLSKGSVRVEVIKAPEGATLEQLNSLGGEAAIAANVVKAEGFNGPVAAGRYFVKAVCLEKAAGTINIEVKPAG